MTRTKRIINIIEALVMLALAVYLLMFPTSSLPLVLGIIALVSSFSTGLMCIGGGLALVALAVLLGLGLTLLIRKMVQLPAKLAHRSKDKGGNNYE